MKQLPQDIEAEKYILGCCLIDNSCIGGITEIVKPEYFYVKLHQEIFTAICRLYIDGQPVDIISINNAMLENSDYKSNGGAAIIKAFLDSVNTTAYYEHHATIIKDKALRRATINIAAKILKDIDDELETKDILDKYQQKLFNISNSNLRNNNLTAIADEVPEAVRNIEFLYANKQSVIGLPCGFKDIDKRIGGFNNGELIIIAGRPSMGKTTFALNIAENVAKKGGAVVIFSLEMNKRLLLNRLISSVSEITANKLKYGNIADAEWGQLSAAMEKLTKMPIYIDDNVDSNAFDIRNKARNAATMLANKGKELKLVVIDYLQLMRGDVKLKDTNTQIADISRQLKALARDLNIPVVVLSQLSRDADKRGVKNSKPVLSDLRDSGAIEQDADVVMFVWREGYYVRNDPEKAKNATIIIGKNRNGGTGEIELTFEPELTKFYDKEKPDEYY